MGCTNSNEGQSSHFSITVEERTLQAAERNLFFTARPLEETLSSVESLTFELNEQNFLNLCEKLKIKSSSFSGVFLLNLMKKQILTSKLLRQLAILLCTKSSLNKSSLIVFSDKRPFLNYLNDLFKISIEVIPDNLPGLQSSVLAHVLNLKTPAQDFLSSLKPRKLEEIKEIICSIEISSKSFRRKLVSLTQENQKTEIKKITEKNSEKNCEKREEKNEENKEAEKKIEEKNRFFIRGNDQIFIREDFKASPALMNISQDIKAIDTSTSSERSLDLNPSSVLMRKSSGLAFKNRINQGRPGNFGKSFSISDISLVSDFRNRVVFNKTRMSGREAVLSQAAIPVESDLSESTLLRSSIESKEEFPKIRSPKNETRIRSPKAGSNILSPILSPKGQSKIGTFKNKK